MKVIIDGIEYPTPDMNGVTIYPTIEFSENYGQTAAGVYAGDRKRVTDNVEITWSNLTTTDLYNLYNLFKTKIFFSFELSENPLDPTQAIAFEARALEDPISILAKIKQSDKYKIDSVTITFAER